jgi:DNA-binding transcriptional MerR regulator
VSDSLLLIGDFAALSGLSPKALRHYDELGLLAPVRVDPATGYRWYAASQFDRARLVALLRHLKMPLAQIAVVLDLAPAASIEFVRQYWADVETDIAQRRATLDYLCTLLSGGIMSTDHTVIIRTIPERVLLSATRHVHLAAAGAVLGEALGRMRQAGPGLTGIEGCPFTIYYGAVTDDSDGPVEIARPMADHGQAEQGAAALGEGVSVRVESAHDEAFVRLAMAESNWPAQLPALTAIESHLQAIGRSAAGAPRAVMIADWRTAGPNDPACDLAVPLEPTRPDAR